jgi:hypothetical protein
MSGDYTRFTFDPRRDRSGVLMQQGRVMLDADFNEQVELVGRRLRAETMDIIGRCIVPIDTPDAFHIQLTGTGGLTIGRGRMYVDGLLAENHGAGPLEWDGSLEEQRGTTAIAYEDQPYLPDAGSLQPAPKDGGPFLVYADVWKREVTPTEDAGLVEKAVGVDTATRTQTVWQVKVYPPPGSKEPPGPMTCETPDEDIPGWLDFTAPSAGRLTTEGKGVPSVDDPCVIPPDGGYRGTENRLYRVEVHDPGVLGAATFTWSRDNASVVSTVTAIDASRTELTVVRTARDSVLRFSTDDWVEVTDDRHELYGLPGIMRKVGPVDDVALTITLTSALPAGEFDATNPERHTRVKRWDQKGIVRDPANNAVDNVDTNGGVITVPAGGTTLALEDGIQVTFSADPAGGTLRPGDYWVFAARTVDASVEELDEAPPRGIHHHYCRLAVVTFPQGPVDDCRVFWPPECAGGGCDCDVCVTVESHNSGQLTIQHAIDQVKQRGGRVCLGPGLYRLEAPVQIAGARSVDLRGKGWTTVLMYLGAGPVIEMQRSLGVTIEEMSIVSSAVAPQPAKDVAAASIFSANAGFGIGLLNCVDVTIRRCAIVQIGERAKAAPFPTLLGLTSATGPAIAVAGFLAKAAIVDNVMVAGFGVLGLDGIDPKEATVGLAAGRAAYTVTADLRIEDNLMFCTRAGIGFTQLTAHIAETRLAGNTIAGCRTGGIVMLGAVLSPQVPASHLDIRRNTLRTLGSAVTVSTDETRIEDNDIAGAAKGSGGDGITLLPRLDRNGMSRCQVRGNRVSAVGGAGISIGGRVSSAIIDQNMIQTATRGGIVMTDGASGGDLTISGNQVLDVGPPDGSPGTDTAGILVLATDRTRVIGNSVAGVATQAVEGAGRRGILVVGSASVSVAGNEIVDIGPAQQFAGEGVGIDVVAPFDRLDVIDNVVRRSSAASGKPDAAQWWAVRVRTVEQRLLSPVGTLIDGARSVLLFGEATIIRLPRGREVVAVRGNLADGFGLVPDIEVRAGGACVVSENRCLLATDKATVVAVSAGAAIAGGNYLEGMPKQTSMILQTGNGPFTVLGNISSGPIEVNGAVLAAPWAALNAQAV